MKYMLVFLAFIGLLTIRISAQDKISLLDFDKASGYLQLNSKQVKIISPMVVQIKTILQEDSLVISRMKARFKSGDEPGFFEKIKVKMQHDQRIDKLNNLLHRIENELNETQREKFNEIDKPVLKKLSKKEITGE